jgi:hypothetical protein
VYAKQKLSPSSPRAAVFLCLFLAIAFLCGPTPSRADSFEDGLTALALKVCLPARKQSIRMNWQMPPEQPGISSESARKAFLTQLSACGIEITENAEAPLLNIAVQFTPSRLLLIAEPGGAADSRSTRMIEIPRAGLAVSKEFPLALHLRKELLWQQEKPISSAVEWLDKSTPQHFLFLLSEGLFVRLRRENGAWIPADSTELPPGRQSRLGRGSFIHGYPGEQIGILLDGKECGLEIGNRVPFTCKRANTGGKVTTVSSACADTDVILVTGTRDHTQTDRVTMAGHEVARLPMSEDEINANSVSMPGPVLEMVTGENGNSVAVVVKNLSTGNYEVYRVTTICDD